jgi:GT2 family glycosyltransferase
MEESKQPLVYVIIVNWNHLEDTIECIESVQKIKYYQYKILLVDNASTEEIAGPIRERYPSVVLIQNRENLGFSGGNNVGIRHALMHGAHYLWLLNNDTVVEPDALLQLVRVGEEDTESGIIGSKIYYYDRPNVISFAGATVDWEKGRSPHTGRGEVDHGQYEEVKEVARVSGCSMLVKRKVCETIGLLDDKFYLYVEDVDWCIRARRAGFRCVIAPGSKIRHKEGITVKEASNNLRIFPYYNTRNFLFLIKKNFDFPKKEILIVKFLFNKLRYMKRSLAKMLLSKIVKDVKLEPQEFAVLIGIKDFFNHKMGKVDPTLL